MKLALATFNEIRQILDESGNIISGRLLSLNKGKQFCVGVMNCNGVFVRITMPKELGNKLSRGDIVSCEGKPSKIGDKWFCIIVSILQVFPCNGKMPNRDYVKSSGLHNTVKAMFDPETFTKLKIRSLVYKRIRDYLSQNKYDEIITPVLFPLKSPSKSHPFSVEYDGGVLYLKTIHEHLLKPYLLTGFQRIYEIGPVFRNIGKSAQYKQEFLNLDIWLLNPDIELLIRMLSEIVSIACECCRANEPSILRRNFSDHKYLSYNNIEQKREIKKTIKESYGSGLVIVTGYPSSLSLHVKTDSNDSNIAIDFHAFLNGESFSHGYILESNYEDIHSPSEESHNDSGCHIFEEYITYGTAEIGGIGIGIDKLLQILFGTEGVDSTNFYKV